MTISVQTYKDYAAFKKSIGSMQKSGTNPHFNSKFVELNTILEVIDDKIEEENCKFIAYLQTSFHKDDKNFLKTELIHESGEILSMDLELITTKKDPQMIGSSLTYMRRYGLMTILGLRAEDDDGNQGSGKVSPASDADFNSAKKRMAKAKYAYSFKEFMAGFNKEKAYNSAQVELLQQVYDHEKAKMEEKAKDAEVKTEETSEPEKKAMDTKTLNDAIDWMINEKKTPTEVINLMQTKYSLTTDQEAAILQKQKMKG